MAKTTFTGTVSGITDQKAQKQIVIVTTPGIPAKKPGDTPTQDKVFHLVTNDHALLDILTKRDVKVSITIETK